MHILFQELKQFFLIFVYTLKGKINEIENISKPTHKNLKIQYKSQAETSQLLAFEHLLQTHL
jgi:hypothetical protein